MNLALHIKSTRRALFMALIIVGVAAGVVFAILQSRSTITGNTISTASVDLLISSDGITYSHSITGFNFTNIVPGGWPAPADGYSVYLKNTGNTMLDLRLAAEGTPSNPNSADLSKLNVALTDVSGDTAPRGFILQSLFGSGTPLDGELAPGATRHYKLQALAADDTAPGATISALDLAFTGVAHDPNQPDQ